MTQQNDIRVADYPYAGDESEFEACLTCRGKGQLRWQHFPEPGEFPEYTAFIRDGIGTVSHHYDEDERLIYHMTMTCWRCNGTGRRRYRMGAE